MNEPKLNVLITCLLFREFTGSEMYVYELATALTKLNCNVTVASVHLGHRLANLAIKNNIRVLPLDVALKQKYDIIHCQHKPITELVNQTLPNIKKVCTIHSEVMPYNLEDPVKHDSIKHYIAIRPEIKQHLIKTFSLKDLDISVIYNPIDSSRFKPASVKQHNAILFVGTIDFLRKEMLYDLAEHSKKTNQILWLVGENGDTYLSDLLKNSNVKHSPSVPDVEEYTKRCSETAGILLGRTTIEGWMCGKPGWIYNIDSSGKVKDKHLHAPPSDMEKFDSNYVAKSVKQIYLNAINS